MWAGSKPTRPHPEGTVSTTHPCVGLGVGPVHLNRWERYSYLSVNGLEFGGNSMCLNSLMILKEFCISLFKNYFCQIYIRTLMFIHVQMYKTYICECAGVNMTDVGTGYSITVELTHYVLTQMS